MTIQDFDGSDDLDLRIKLARLAITSDSPKETLEAALNSQKFNLNLLFAYVRAFVRLAYLRDIEAAADEIETSRQTVARHVFEFENLLGCKLFTSVGAKSDLTEQGALWLPRMLEIYELCMQILTARNELQTNYKHFQIPLREMSVKYGAPKLLEDFKTAWMRGNQQLDCPHLHAFRPYWIVYERKAGTWHAREIGPRCSLSCWYGPETVKQSVGLSVPDMVSGLEFKDEVSFLLDGLYSKGGMHFSEVRCNLTRPGETGLVPVRYYRALAELTDEKDAAVIASVIEAPHMWTETASWT